MCVCVSFRVCCFCQFLLVFACLLLALCLSCESLATALGYYGASPLLGVSIVLLWHQPGSFRLSWALLGVLFGLSQASLGTLLGRLGDAQGALFERDNKFVNAFFATFGSHNKH